MDEDGVPLTRLEEMLTERGIPVPEPAPAVATLGECLAAIAPPEPTPQPAPLAGGSDAPATLSTRPAPTYDQVAAAYRQYDDEELAGEQLDFLMEHMPDQEARRVMLLASLRQRAAMWLDAKRAGAPQEPDALLAELSKGGRLAGLLDAWDRGEGCQTEPASRAATLKPSAAAVEARVRQKLGAKGAHQARASRIKGVQARAREKAAANGEEPNYKDGGYRPMPNLFSIAFVAAMPGPVAKAYIVACQLAEDDGSFEISHSTLAERIGSKYRSHGERAMRRLVDAGLVNQRWRGGPGRPNGYRLASLARLDVETAKAVLNQPLTASGGSKARESVDQACA
jgi:hypothetical protein